MLKEISNKERRYGIHHRNLKADQIISGTALNLFAPAFSIFIARMIQENGVQQINFNNTFFGLRLKACGEHPHAADSVGILPRRRKQSQYRMTREVDKE